MADCLFIIELWLCVNSEVINTDFSYYPQQFEFLPFQGCVKLSDPDHVFSLLVDYGDDSNTAPPLPDRMFFGRLVRSDHISYWILHCISNNIIVKLLNEAKTLCSFRCLCNIFFHFIAIIISLLWRYSFGSFLGGKIAWQAKRMSV